MFIRPKPFHFAIDDKVDYVLIDEGRNPLLISGEASKDAARYPVAAKVVELLMRGLVFYFFALFFFSFLMSCYPSPLYEYLTICSTT
uniref:chloroplast protein-transporting ATPase n=1 Tax=Lactuca sativa TaxID=4236 RepID=A0A9R1WIR2_LACSA|nr:hypothetical protein LSAT_V11C200067970 [Lactuca sativa]